jgi:hypothetical protein
MVRFDVPAQVGLKLKVPDIEIMDSETGASFYCEVSTLYSAQVHGEQSRLLKAVHTALTRNTIPVAFAGRLLRPIADEDVGGLINRIQWELMEIENDPSFREVDVGGLQLALAPARLGDHVSAWAQEHGLESNLLCGALPAADQVERLRLKIKDEALQLPPGQPNLVVILAQDLLIDVADWADLIHSDRCRNCFRAPQHRGACPDMRRFRPHRFSGKEDRWRPLCRQ